MRLTTGEGSELRPRPSPKGDWIAFDVVDEHWFSSYSQICCADWSPDGSRLAVVVTTREKLSSMTVGIVSIDTASGSATAMRRLTMLPGGAPEYGRWSPDGRFIVYEALTDSSWDLWIVDPDAPAPRRLTMSAENDRQAVWQKHPRTLFFRRDNREVWRMPFDDTGTPAGAATRWLGLPGRLTLTADSLDISPSDDRMLVTLAAPASDVWLVELK